MTPNTSPKPSPAIMPMPEKASDQRVFLDLSEVTTGPFSKLAKTLKTGQDAYKLCTEALALTDDISINIQVNPKSNWTFAKMSDGSMVMTKFQSALTSDGRDVNMLIAQYRILGDEHVRLAGAEKIKPEDLKVCMPMPPAKIDSIASRDIKDYFKEISLALKLQRSAPLVLLHNPQGVVALDYHPYLGKVDSTGGQTVYVSEQAKMIADDGAIAYIVNRKGFLLDIEQDTPTYHSGDEFSKNLKLGVLEGRDGLQELVKKEDLYERLETLAIDLARKGIKPALHMPHYVDGLIEAVMMNKISQTPEVPIVWTPHSLGWLKALNTVTGEASSLRAKINEAGDLNDDSAELSHLSDLQEQLQPANLKDLDAAGRDVLMGQLDERYPKLNLKKRISEEQKLLLSEVDYAVSTSEAIRQQIVDVYHYPQERVVEMEPGYNSDVYNSERSLDRQSTEWDQFLDHISKITGQDANFLRQNCDFICEVSRTDGTKGKIHIVEAINQLRHAHKETILLTNVASVQKMNKQNKGAQASAKVPNPVGKEIVDYIQSEHDLQYSVCNFPGNVPQQLVEKMYAISDIYVTQSRMEGFGMSLLEAAGSGKLCVFTEQVPFGMEYLLGQEDERQMVSHNDQQFLVGKAGIVVKFGDTKTLTAALDWSKAEENEAQVSEMRALAEQIARKDFPWKVKHDGLFEQLGVVRGPDGQLSKDSFKGLKRRQSQAA